MSNSMNFLRATLLSFTMATFVSVPAWSRSLVGMSLPDAQKQDYFKENDSKPEPNQTTIVSFVTGVQKFSVQLAVIIDKDKNITAMALVLPRSFIDDPASGVLARDVAKSFLSAAIADSDLKSVQSLISEIEFGGQALKTVNIDQARLNGVTVPGNVLLTQSGTIKKGDQAWLGTGAPPALPAVQSDGYLAYMGKKDEFDRSFPSCNLHMTNKAFPDKLLINVAVAPR
jgi:hypothetical protein